MNLPDKDQYLNIITLLKKVLEFYSKEENYIEDRFTGTDAYSLIELDRGEQARTVLDQVEDFEKQIVAMESEYEELLKTYGSPDNVPVEDRWNKLLKDFKKIKDGH